MHSKVTAMPFPLLIVLLCSVASHASIVTVTSNRVKSNVQYGNNPIVTKTDNDKSVPHTASHDLSDSLNGYLSRTQTDINWSENATQTILDHTFIHTRGVGRNNLTFASTIEFTANEDAAYLFTGGYGYTSDDDDGRIKYSVSFWDNTAGEYLFYTVQESRSTLGQQFDLDSQAGDFYNSIEPGSSLSGMLIKDHSYSLGFVAFTDNLFASDGAVAQGSVKLTIGDPEAVPEPSSIITLAGLLATFGAFGWWKKRKQAV